MSRIFKNTIISIFRYFIFSDITKHKFKLFIDNLSIHLKSLSIWNLSQTLKNLVTNSSSENSNLTGIANPLSLDWKILSDSKPKNLFLVGFVLTIVANRWLYYFKKIILWPFKLGNFSFVYSVLGFDVTWFLNIWSYFTVNIPNWVYIQYLTLFNNWLDWWYNTVKIKSLTSVPLVEAKKKL